MDELPLVVRLHLFLLDGVAPVVALVGELALVPELVDPQLVALRVHGRDHRGGVDGGLEDRVDRHGVVERHAAPARRRLGLLALLGGRRRP